MAPQRILVVRPDRIGDVVLATPLLRALRKHFPSAFIAALVRPYTEAVLAHNPNVDLVFADDNAGAHAGISGFLRQVHALRRLRFDSALMLLPSARHAWMLFLAGVRSRIGTSRKPYHVLTLARTISRRKYIPLRHEADYCLDLGRAIGAPDDGLDVEVFLTESERAWARERLGAGTWVAIHPGSGRSSPNWRPAHYAQLTRLLLDLRADVRVVLTGGPDERGPADAFGGIDRDRVLDLIGELSLRETMAVISQLELLVSASTGTMHIAAGLGVPTVSLFCPLSSCSPELWGPRGNRSEIILPREDFCQNQCPGDPHVCRFEGGIGVEEVLAGVAEALPAPR